MLCSCVSKTEDLKTAETSKYYKSLKFSVTQTCVSCFQLSKLTVPVLKDFVKAAGIKCSSKKADLIEAIKEHFGV